MRDHPETFRQKHKQRQNPTDRSRSKASLAHRYFDAEINWASVLTRSTT
ncbi:MAG: hypothetical protein ACI8QF_004463, partial [Limisphaerales bacterium]